MSRSLWKGFFSEILNLEKKVNTEKRIWSRRSMILPRDVGKEFFVHNGKIFIPVKVNGEMVGHKFGEFSNTRKKVFHKVTKKKSSK
jgi:small subunit ribosomal protein S19